VSAALPTLAIRPLRRRMLVAWAIAIVLGTGAYQMASWSSAILPRANGLEELAYYPSGDHLAPATLGHAQTAADLAWLRAVQYYGEHRKRDNQFVHLYHVFDILTSLAPRFESAYIFGAFALAQEGRDFPHAEQLIRKGIEANPRSGRLAFEAGFLYYVKPNGRDLAHAAEYFELASRLPGAPAAAAEFAAFAHQNSGGTAVAYRLWQEIHENTRNTYLRDIAEKEMARIRQSLDTGNAQAARVHLTTPIVVVDGKR
jgi:hypothetical protein